MKNDNLDILFTVGGYTIHILKFSCEKQTWTIPKHFHSSNSYEIHYIFSGKGTLNCQGRGYPLKENNLYTTGPYVEHEQIPDPADSTGEYCIYLRIEKDMPKGAFSDQNTETAFHRFLDTPFWFGSDQYDLPKVLNEIRTELSTPNIAGEMMLRALFMQFFVGVLRNYDAATKKEFHTLAIPLAKAYILIEDSFLYEYATITLETLSQRLGLSTRQTRRILFQRYSQTFTAKRTEARMAAAAMFLREGVTSAEELAAKTGYASANHFYAAFKKYYHLTLSQYREKVLSSAPPV